MAKEIKAFELTQAEMDAIKAKVTAEKTEGGVKEAVKRAAVEKAMAFLKDMKQCFLLFQPCFLIERQVGKVDIHILLFLIL